MSSNSKNLTDQSVLHVKRSRRSFLRGAGITAAGVAGMAAFSKIDSASAAGPIHQIHPPVQVLKAEPVGGSVFLAERVGARHSLELDTWRPTGHVWLKNTSAQEVTLSGMRVSYVGAGAPGPLETLQLVKIPAGKTKVVPIAETRLLALPVAPIIKVECFIMGYTPPVTYITFMHEFTNAAPEGAYDFPGKTSDLNSGEFWYQGDNHGYGSNHGNSRSQRFAYDLKVARYTGTSWTHLRAPKYTGEVVDGSKNDHFSVWGTPVYAVASGTIIQGYRLRKDNSAPGVKDAGPGGGGNGFWILHEPGNSKTGGYMLYAHMMAGSVPFWLVPVEGGGGVQVQKGQFLGLVGNSGNSTGPHLHIHLQRGWDDEGEGMPLRFKHVLYRQYSGYDPGSYFQWWNPNSSHSALANNTLVDALGPTTGMAFNPVADGNMAERFALS